MSIYPSNTLPYEPFVYLIGWSHLNTFYIGCRFGISKNAHPSQLWSTYFTSSTHVKLFHEIYGEPDIIRIEKTFVDSQKCLTYEHKLLARMKTLKDPRFLNKSIGGKKFTGGSHSKETREKMRIAAKNRPPVTEETRKKHSEISKNMSAETRQKISDSGKGRVCSKETIEKMCIAQQISKQNISDETKLKMSIAALNKPPTTDETKLKMCISQRNRASRPKHSEEAKLKMRIAHRNRPPRSEESKRKTSESVKKTLAAKRALKESMKII